MPINEIIRRNKLAGRMRADKGLSQKTIVVNYVGKIKTIFRYICANENIPNPFKESSALIPKVDKQSLVRQPLPIGSVKALFCHCAKSERADEFFLPVLGALTGARLSELVYLQGRNIVDRHNRGHYTANLTMAVITDDGEHMRRPTKNDTSSLRFIVLHDALKEIGFIEWAKSRPGWLFPELHTQAIQRPGDTASKRFQRIFRLIEIHEERTEVFHSLRHYYKDWVRSCQIPDRTIDIQTGHAMGSVGQRYGSKHLRPDEVDMLATCAIPNELDVLLNPYRRRQAFETVMPPKKIKIRSTPRRLRRVSLPAEIHS